MPANATPAPLPQELPADPFGLVTTRGVEPAARRVLSLLGAEVELLWLPQRATRPGIPTRGQPPFRAATAERILAEETLWRGHGCALTPNRFPFASRQLVLWAEAPVRELTPAMLALALQLEVATGGTLLLNTIGAAASIPRAHVHLVAERLPFLAGLATEPYALPGLEPAGAIELVRLAAPYPALALGLRGPPADRARAAARLLELRATPAVNLVSSAGTTWIVPRSGIEIPAPHFPHALGAAELWGRWCYADRGAFERAGAGDLLAAIALGGLALPPAG